MNALLPVALGLVAAFAVALLVFAFLNRLNEASISGRRQQALASYGTIENSPSADQSTSESAIGAAIDRYRNNLQQQLNTASISISAVNWMTMQVAITVLAFLMLSARLQNTIVALIAALLLAFFGTRFVVSSRTQKRIADFEANLPQTLQLLASGIRSGLTFEQAIESSSTQDRSEVGRQFRLASAESQLDNELEAALLRVANRMKSEDLKWLVSALQIQREIGGSLSGILDTVAETIRARADIRREVRVLSAEGKLSGYVLIAMPFVVLLALMVIRPTYVSFFWTDPVGVVMGIVFLVLAAVGWFWLQRIVKVKA